jgi:hypothetical protein
MAPRWLVPKQEVRREPARLASPSPSPDRAEVWPGATTQGWDAIDEASWVSFPAIPPASRVASPVPAVGEPAIDDGHSSRSIDVITILGSPSRR